MLNREKIVRRLLDAAKLSLRDFLTFGEEDAEYYAFAFLCDPAHGIVSLACNDESAFEETFGSEGKDGQKRKEQRYTVQEWAYQFADIEAIAQDDLLEAYTLDEEEADSAAAAQEAYTGMMRIFEQAFWEFLETREFAEIPKTEDFAVLCVRADKVYRGKELDAVLKEYND